MTYDDVSCFTLQYNKNYFIKFEKQEANNANPQRIEAYEFGQVSPVDVSKQTNIYIFGCESSPNKS